MGTRIAASKYKAKQFLSVLILAACTAATLTAILYAAQAVWRFYEFAGQGSQHLQVQGLPPLIALFAAKGIPRLAIESTLIALLVTQGAAAVSHFFGLATYLYHPIGNILRLIVWGCPFAGLAAYVMQQAGLTPTVEVAFWLTLLPALLLVAPCFRLADNTLPEISFLLSGVQWASKGWDSLIQWLSLVVLTAAVNIVILYLLGLALALEPLSPIIKAQWAEMGCLGQTPLDLAGICIVFLSVRITFTVFVVCLISAAIGQLLAQAVSPSSLPRSRMATALGFVPLFILLSGLGVRYVNQIEPLQAAVALAIIPTLCLYRPLNNQARDIVLKFAT